IEVNQVSLAFLRTPCSLRRRVPTIGRVRLTSGNAALGAAQSGNDLVVMDDFIYGEPQLAALIQTPVPTVSGWGLLAMGVALAAGAVLLLAWKR
ncbi:MAG: hypothetical protein ABR610_08450, partial [Thermoanaerobaculia bacterium]